MFCLLNDEKEFKSRILDYFDLQAIFAVYIQKLNEKGVLMKKVIIILISMTLFACGGGGGGGGGSSDTGSNIIHANDYTNRDITKVYTFNETVVDTTGGNNTPSQNEITYRYVQNVSNIPSKYDYSGTIPGPYTEEIMALNGADKGFTYFGASSRIIGDDSTFFTNIDHSGSSGVIPADWTVGMTYPESSTEDLFNSTSGLKVGTRITEHTLKAIDVENVTVPAGTYKAVKTEESTVKTITVVGGTETITTTSSSWYSNNIALVKIIANTTDVFTDGSSTQTLTYTTTDELKSVSQ
jgi:hypothetical protein